MTGFLDSKLCHCC